MNFVAMSAGAAALLVVSALAGETFALPGAGKTQIALVYLVAATVGLLPMVLDRGSAVDGLVDVVHLRPDARLAAGARRPRRRRADNRDYDPRGAIRLLKGVSRKLWRVGIARSDL